ncbi:MAG: diguanylate cyclase [Chloroflexi bacterium]|nr:diguanylate cyclase [Chloroflexota bacterium]
MPNQRRVLAWSIAGLAGATLVVALVLGTIEAAVVGGVAAMAMWCGFLARGAGLRDGVESLAAATRAIVGARDRHMPEPSSFGALAPVAAGIVQLQERLATAVEAATTDRLTHVANRPMLLATLYDEVERAARYGRPLTVAFIDLDLFKPVNDTYGHEVGDRVLERIAAVLRHNVRRSDTIGRYGGEEFVVVFAETTVDEATAVAEKLRLQVSKERFTVAPGEELGVTVSIGLAGGHGQPLRVDDLLRDADAAMYAAKSLGRDQTYVFAEADDDSARIPRAPISKAARAAAAEVAERGRRAAEAALASVIMPLPHYRGRPSSLIATIAMALARRLELPDAEVERVRVASLLHDIGKVGVPDEILEKPGPLSPDEWQSVVQHPRIGQEILNRVAAVKDAAAIILHHHERYSGHGYPHGLRGSDIPLGARIVAVADAYEAMLSDRPYRNAIGHEAAIAELRAQAGTQFDPELVELFCRMFADAPPEADPSVLFTPATDGREVAPLHRPRRRRSASSA